MKIKNFITIFCIQMMPLLMGAQTYTLGIGETEYLWIPEIRNGYVETAKWYSSSSAVSFVQSDEICAEVQVVSAFSGTVTVGVNYIGQYELNDKWYATKILNKEWNIQCSDSDFGGGSDGGGGTEGVKATSISLPESITLTKYSHIDLVPEVTPSNATLYSTWGQTMASGDIAEVDPWGHCVAVSTGEAVVNYKDWHSGLETSMTVIVVEPEVSSGESVPVSDQSVNSTFDKIKYLIDKTKEYLKK